MNTHLSIEVEGKKLTLPSEDFAIDIDMRNPMFNDEDTFSYPIQVPLDGNRHFVQNLEDKRSTLRPVSLENKKTRIYTDGFPFFTGKISTSDDEEVTDSISLNVEGENTLADLISDLDCRDIPVKDELLIGRKIGDVSATIKGHAYIAVYQDGADYFFQTPEQEVSVNFSPQALGFSRVETSNINVDKAYPDMPYCNARVAYKHYALGDDGKTSDNIDNTGLYGAYYVLDANRQQSGICFYVLYFLDCLFSYLGLEWDNSELTAIEDMKRLCFYTTHCKYDEEFESVTLNAGSKDLESLKAQISQKYSISESSIVVDTDPDILKSLNDWLTGEKSGAQMALRAEEWSAVNCVTIPKDSYCYHVEGGSLIFDDRTLSKNTYISQGTEATLVFPKQSFKTNCETILAGWDSDDDNYKKDAEITSCSYTVTKMYANSQNWPDESVSTILESLENQFGIRFIYDAEKKKVTARLLRGVYRDQSSARNFLGTIHEMNKVSEKITGVRIGYDSESDSKEQQNNLRDSVKDYDTSYDYIDFPAEGKGASSAGLSQAKETIIKADVYKEICAHATNQNNNVYVDLTTGNAYRVKLNSEASSQNELQPAWFEVGQFKSAEFGDCSVANEDYIVELMSSFTPVPLSDVNAKRTIQNPGSTDENFQPLLTPFVDEDMLNEKEVQYLDYPADVNIGDIGIRATLECTENFTENYDVTSTDDGNSPLQTYDWGLSIAIMRGGGTNATRFTYEKNYDGFGNSKWGTAAGLYLLDTDSINLFGDMYDYNGNETSLMKGERFSLKPRGYRNITWCSAPQCQEDKVIDAETNPWHYYYRTRGYVDRFLFEHANFLLNRRKFIIRCECTAAFLADIPNHWAERWKINGEIGYINKVSTSISVDSGIGESTIEFYAI